MANQSSQVKWSYIFENDQLYPAKFTFFLTFRNNLILIYYLGNSISISFDNIESKGLLIVFAIIINGQLKQPSEMELHIENDQL
jgi:hypothetical protein